MRFALQILLVASAAVFGACRNGGSVVDTGGRSGDKVPAGQIALVEHEYINHAWGYQHKGIVVTGDGKILSYEWERGDAPWAGPDGPIYSAADLEAKYAHNTTPLGTIGADTLELIERLIPAAARGTLTEREVRGADMGQAERIGWLLDTTAKTYRKVTLRSDGDWVWYNTSAEAARLADIIDVIVERYR